LSPQKQQIYQARIKSALNSTQSVSTKASKAYTDDRFRVGIDLTFKSFGMFAVFEASATSSVLKTKKSRRQEQNNQKPTGRIFTFPTAYLPKLRRTNW